jgi:uncharacterized protein (TIGR01777 family)
MHLLISGGTGLIGSALSRYFVPRGWSISILTRHPHQQRPAHPKITYIGDPEECSDPYDGIIHLAGEPLHAKRWTAAVKKTIELSRTQTTERLVSYIQGASVKPRFFISGSAIGYYGTDPDRRFTEESESIPDGFTHQLCVHWERAAMEAAHEGVRVCTLRTGIVLARNQGFLKPLIPLFQWGLGMQFGDGNQWMSWIHIDDVVRIIEFLIKKPHLSGPFNLTAPEAVPHKVLMNQLAATLKRPCLLKIPERLATLLLGEMAETLILKGQNVFPEKLLRAGYLFKYPSLGEALANL